jgi:hypothetical protein
MVELASQTTNKCFPGETAAKALNADMPQHNHFVG